VSQFFSLATKVRLARSILTKDQPIYVQFYVTARCNLACEQCNIIYANSDVTEIPLEGIRRVAENLERIGVGVVLLTGGEPFVRKDLPEIVREFASRGMHVRIQTNGLAAEKDLIACVEAGAHDISISLDAIHPGVQEAINGGFPGSWARAIESFATVNRIFPAASFASLGCVFAPSNFRFIPDVIRFATKIGWYVSIVPAHVTSANRPLNFRSFDGCCRFEPADYPEVRAVIDEIRRMRAAGFLVYDSDEYLEDMYRFIRGERLTWRDRNDGVCDSPNLYFAVLPNGQMAVCCDWRMDSAVSVASPDFPERFFGTSLRREVRDIAARCPGCLYGSFPEMTITTRYLKPLVRRFLLFNSPTPHLLKKLSRDEMIAEAGAIRAGSAAPYPPEP
jgi:hypothetical protein